MGEHGYLYCGCGKEFEKRNASQTKCDDCLEKEKNKKKEKPRERLKLYCRDCHKETIHKYIGIYHGDEFYECTQQLSRKKYCKKWRKI